MRDWENGVEGERSDQKPVVALVLASGGLKPFSALPLIEFLDRENISVDLLVGASGGGILAAMRACGQSCDEIRSQLSELSHYRVFQRDWRSMLSLFHLPGGRFDKSSGLFKPDRFRQMCTDCFGEQRLETLPHKCMLQTTDFDTGEGVCLSRGRLADAVYASMAIHPFLPPIQIDGRWLFDGCFSAPVPIMPAVAFPADVIIVLEVLEQLKSPEQGFQNFMVHTSKIQSQTMLRSQASLSVLLHHHEIIFVKVRFEKYLQIWDFDQLPNIIAAGDAATAKYGDEIRSAIRDFRSRPEAMQAGGL